MHSNVCYNVMMTSSSSNDSNQSGFIVITMCILEQHSNPYNHMSMTSSTSNDIYHSGYDLITICILNSIVISVIKLHDYQNQQ